MRVLLFALVALGMLLVAPGLEPIGEVAAECVRADPGSLSFHVDTGCDPLGANSAAS